MSWFKRLVEKMSKRFTRKQLVSMSNVLGAMQLAVGIANVVIFVETRSPLNLFAGWVTIAAWYLTRIDAYTLFDCKYPKALLAVMCMPFSVATADKIAKAQSHVLYVCCKKLERINGMDVSQAPDYEGLPPALMMDILNSLLALNKKQGFILPPSIYMAYKLHKGHVTVWKKKSTTLKN